MQMTLTEMEQKVIELRQQTADLESEIRTLTIKIVREKWGVTPGALVTEDGVLYRIHSIDRIWDFNKPWVKANPKKKDGTWGNSIRCLLRWELVK